MSEIRAQSTDSGNQFVMLIEAIIEFNKLTETQGIVDYHNKFEIISSRFTLTEDYLVGKYLAGLNKDTQMNVRMFQPQTVRQCFMIARLYESAHPRRSSDEDVVEAKSCGVESEIRTRRENDNQGGDEGETSPDLQVDGDSSKVVNPTETETETGVMAKHIDVESETGRDVVTDEGVIPAHSVQDPSEDVIPTVVEVIDKSDWVAAIGVVGDGEMRQNVPLLDSTQAEFGVKSLAAPMTANTLPQNDGDSAREEDKNKIMMKERERPPEKPPEDSARELLVKPFSPRSASQNSFETTPFYSNHVRVYDRMPHVDNIFVKEWCRESGGFASSGCSGTMEKYSFTRPPRKPPNAFCEAYHTVSDNRMTGHQDFEGEVIEVWQSYVDELFDSNYRMLKFIVLSSVLETCIHFALLLNPRRDGKLAVLELVHKDVGGVIECNPDMISVFRPNGMLQADDKSENKEIASHSGLEPSLSFPKLVYFHDKSQFMITKLSECGLAHEIIISVLDEFALFSQWTQRLLYVLFDAMQSVSSQVVVLGGSCGVEDVRKAYGELSLDQSVTQKLGFHVPENLKWGGCELLNKIGLLSKKIAEVNFVELQFSIADHSDISEETVNTRAADILHWPHLTVVSTGGMHVGISGWELRPSVNTAVIVSTAKDLNDIGIIGKSDPYVVDYVRPAAKPPDELLEVFMWLICCEELVLVESCHLFASTRVEFKFKDAEKLADKNCAAVSLQKFPGFDS